MTMPSCTAEGGDVLPRQHAAEPYSRAVDAAIRRVQGRSRPEKSRPRHPPQGQVPPQVGSPRCPAGWAGSSAHPRPGGGSGPSCRRGSESAPRTTVSSSGSLAGRMTGAWSLRTHSACTTAAIIRSTPRVRWNRSRVDPSLWSRSNTSGWIGYAAVMRRVYAGSRHSAENSAALRRQRSANVLATACRWDRDSSVKGSKSRRRTISKDSSAKAGRQAASIFRSRASVG